MAPWDVSYRFGDLVGTAADAGPRTDQLNRSKRVFDLFLVVLALPVWAPLLLFLVFLVLLADGRPVFYRAARAGQGGRSFGLFKLRTMSHEPCAPHVRLSGGHTQARVSRVGAVLRHTRLDELPQIWNVLMGDLSLVGPRPPDPYHMRQNWEQYQAVLSIRPGLTGLGSLCLHRFEDRVLGHCLTNSEAEEVYARRCLPKKFRLEHMYRRHSLRRGHVWIDLWILLRSLLKILA